MKDIRSTVMQLSGRWGNEYYNILCLAVEAAQSAPPDDFQMKRIWSEVRAKCGKSTDSISRALSRAALDIWQRGNREKLSEIFDRKLTQAPTPKELICVLADYLRPRVEYRCWSVGFGSEFGIQASDDFGAKLMTAPFTKNKALVETLVSALNVSQKPLEEFRMEFLTGEIPGVLTQEPS